MKKKTWIILITLSVVFLVSISFLAIMLRRQANSMFSAYVENQLHNHSALYAMIVEERFERELEELDSIAAIIEEDPAKADAVISTANGSAGSDLTLDETLRVTAPEISFTAGSGLSFAYPLAGGGALVRTWPENEMLERFAVDPHDKRMRICVVDSAGQVIIPFVNGSEEDEEFYNSDAVTSKYKDLIAEASGSGTATGIVMRGDEQMLLYAARVGEYDYYAEGFMPQNIFSERAGMAGRLRIRGFIIVFSIVFIGLVRLLTMRKKVQENE